MNIPAAVSALALLHAALLLVLSRCRTGLLRFRCRLLPHRPHLSARPAGLHAGPRLSRRPPLREHRHRRQIVTPQRRPRNRSHPQVPGGARQYFAEGLTDWGNTLIQLTWQSHVAFVYDRSTFRFLRTFHYDGEGWGLTHDAKSLILSDGSQSLRFFDPATFRETRRITVKDHGKPVHAAQRARIHPRRNLRQRLARGSHRPHLPCNRPGPRLDRLARPAPGKRTLNPEAVLNGIAYDAAHDRLFVTGKLWPKIFEIKIVPDRSKANSR